MPALRSTKNLIELREASAPPTASRPDTHTQRHTASRPARAVASGRPRNMFRSSARSGAPALSKPEKAAAATLCKCIDVATTPPSAPATHKHRRRDKADGEGGEAADGVLHSDRFGYPLQTD